MEYQLEDREHDSRKERETVQGQGEGDHQAESWFLGGVHPRPDEVIHRGLAGITARLPKINQTEDLGRPYTRQDKGLYLEEVENTQI
ncbi:MAG: hypothetical protein LBR53_07190 [Deltaproteobacteria bacterium]|nr:hypothetical protein [Deltaproteobacteria bacterium]